MIKCHSPLLCRPRLVPALCSPGVEGELKILLSKGKVVLGAMCFEHVAQRRGSTEEHGDLAPSLLAQTVKHLM